MGALAGVRLAFSTLTALPIGPPSRVDRAAAGRAMLAAPLVGLALGVLASGVGWGVQWWSGSALIAAIACVATLAAATRGLHLDGLADTADGLGSAKPAEDALRIMKASDIGPFGVITLILTLAGQTYLLADAWQRHGARGGAAALIVAAMTGRLAVTWACRTGVPSARPDGLGAWVAGSVSRTAVAVASVAVLGSAAALGASTTLRTGTAVGHTAVGGTAVVGTAITGTGTGTGTGTDLSHLLLWPASVAFGVAASAAMLRHAVRRFGGITGDVLGTLVEIGFTATLFVLLRG